MAEIAARLEIQPEVKTRQPRLAVQIGKLGFERDERMIGAGDVARAAGTDAMPGRSRAHRLDHLRIRPMPR